MSLRPFFPYYGSKWSSARAYPPPIYPRIVEPFAGSAGYALRYPDRDVLLVDLNPRIAELWRWLIRVEPDEVLQLPDVPEGVSVHELGLSGPARDLVGFWLNPGQVIPAARRSRWRTAEYGHKGWGEGVRRRIAEQVLRIRHWRVHEGQYFEASALVTEPATWFCDPVYRGPPGRTYRTPPLDYEHLAGWVQDLRGQVICCEAAGATWLPFRAVWRTKGAVFVRDARSAGSQVGPQVGPARGQRKTAGGVLSANRPFSLGNR